MTLMELHVAIHKLLNECPEAASMEVFQTSCFDDPYRFPTSGVYVGELYTAVGKEDEVAWFNNDCSAAERAESYGNGAEVKQSEVVVIGAY